MAAVAFFEEVGDRSDRRSSVRQVLRLTTAASIEADTNVLALIHDISADGLLMETTAQLSTGASFELELPETEPIVATVVWKRGDYVGCEFAEPLRKAVLSAAMLKNPALAPPQPISDETAAPTSEPSSASKLAPGTRLWIILGLSLAAWAIVATLLLLL